MTERCETCRYWVADFMECRRNPPVSEPGRRNARGHFPQTQWTDWCGEWRERERDPMAPDQR